VGRIATTESGPPGSRSRSTAVDAASASNAASTTTSAVTTRRRLPSFIRTSTRTTMPGYGDNCRRPERICGQPFGPVDRGLLGRELEE
jgi:hypothetical protein